MRPTNAPARAVVFLFVRIRNANGVVTTTVRTVRGAR